MNKAKGTARIRLSLVAVLTVLHCARCVRSEELAALARLEVEFGTVSAVAFSPDGKILLTGDGKFGEGSGTVRFWDVGTWVQREQQFRHRNKITSIAYSPDGTHLASASLGEFLRPPELYLRDLKNGNTHGPLDNEIFAVWCVAISADGKTLASAHESGRVKLWNIPDATLRIALEGHKDRVRSLAFSRDGTRLASGSPDGEVKLWDVADNGEIASLTDDGFRVSTVVFSADGQRLAAAGGRYDVEAKKWTTGGVRLWDISERKVLRHLDGHAEAARSVVFGPGDLWLASASRQGIGKTGDAPGELRFWNSTDGAEILSVKLAAGLNSLAVSPDGRFLAAGCDDSMALVWDVSGISVQK